ncbi:hypothetical protein BpHYR1_003206 [Brachionus plicatilis]|uniref:Uncharacterized protein n=1 Tax=Brachionus plicatilis TaxID=10195 RepID=A0A3M7QAA3_BRAPC|nr:hypothetical protein BpHYR1_003206 [Brachionus plicatilis]
MKYGNVNLFYKDYNIVHICTNEYELCNKLQSLINYFLMVCFLQKIAVFLLSLEFLFDENSIFYIKYIKIQLSLFKMIFRRNFVTFLSLISLFYVNSLMYLLTHSDMSL